MGLSEERRSLLGSRSKEAKAKEEGFYNSLEDGAERGLNLFTIMALFCAVLGGLTFGLDIGTTAATSMDSFREAVGLPLLPTGNNTSESVDPAADEVTLFAVLFHVSTLVGAPIAGAVADRYGRKKVIIASSVVFLGGCVWQVCSKYTSFAWTSILLGRVLGGLGNGFMLTVMPLYASELAPKSYRGQALTMFQLFITIGIFIMAVVNNFVEDKSWGWQLAIGLQAIPCLLILLLAGTVLPESPQYLLKTHRTEAAENALYKLCKGSPSPENLVSQDLREMQEEILMIEQATQEKASFLDLVRGDLLPCFLCGFFIAFSQNVTGVNWFMNYATVLFNALQFNMFAMDLVLKGVNMLATVVSLFVIERLGRKFLTFWGTMLVIFTFLFIYILIVASGIDPYDSDPDTKTKTVQTVIMVMIFFFQAIFAITWGPLGWLVPSEVFPLRVRGKGNGMCVVANMATNLALGDYGYQAIFTNTSLQTTILVLVILNSVIVLPTVMFLQPETKGVSMQEMHEAVFAYQPGGGDRRGTMKAFYKRNFGQTKQLLKCQAIPAPQATTSVASYSRII